MDGKQSKVVKLRRTTSNRISEHHFSDFLSLFVNPQDNTTALSAAPLAGIDRAVILEKIMAAKASVDQNGKIFGILRLDLNRLKIIDGTLLHQCGDEVIHTVVKRLQSIMRKTDSFLSLGGDEFLIIANDIHNRDDLVTISNKLIKSLKESINLFGHKLMLKMSIGISVYPEDTTKMKTLLENANDAMYHSKELGDNQFKFYSKELHK